MPLPLGDNKINTDLARSFKQGWQHLGWDKTTPIVIKIDLGMGSNLDHQGYCDVVSQETQASFAPKRHDITSSNSKKLTARVVVLQN